VETFTDTVGSGTACRSIVHSMSFHRSPGLVRSFTMVKDRWTP
jgi:hypothetical protein